MVCSPAVASAEVRPMQPTDIEQVVALQTAFLEGSLVTDLGSRFLRSFYRAALRQSHTRAFVAVDGRSIVGLAVGTVDVARFNAHVRPRILAPMFAAILAPHRWAIAAALLRMPFEPAPQPPIPAELLVLVVDSRRRQHGIGRALLAALERAFHEACVEIYRVAVRSHLAVARAFYRALGFEFEQELPVLGRPMTYLSKHVARVG